jgi:hypothetical protein
MVLSFTGAPSASLTVFCPAAWLPLNTQTYANMAPVSGTAAPLTWKLNAYQDITFGGTVANKFNGVPRFILQANGPGNVTGGFMTLSNTYRIRVYYKPRI